MSRLRPKLTYANVVSTICLCLLVGGGAAIAAGHLGKNTVGPKQLRKNAVTTAKVKKEAITAAKVKKGTLTGAQINSSTLGTVPSAANAETLGGLTSAQISEASKLKCPSGMALAAGTCFETSARAAAPIPTALQICGEINRALPSMGELVAYEAQTYSNPPKAEWIGQMYFDGVNFRGHVVTTSKGGVVTTSAPEFNQPNLYRCVTGPTN
jgi:hypothetical protein